MDNAITANELKTKGVSRLDQAMATGDEAVITVHGKQRYVVLSIDHYNHLRECELEAAIIETQKDLADGNVIRESVEDHIKRITGA